MNDVVFGTLALAAGLALAARTRAFLRTTRRVTGEVVAYESRTDEEGDTTHTPVFRFTAANGAVVTAPSTRGGSAVRRHRIGARLELVHNPGRPEEVWPATTRDAWALPVVLGLLGLWILARRLLGG